MEKSNKTVWDSMLSVYKKTKDKSVLMSLSCVKNKTILNNYLKTLLSNDTIIPRSKILDVLCSIFSKDSELTLNFVINNLEKINEKYEKLWFRKSVNLLFYVAFILFII